MTLPVGYSLLVERVEDPYAMVLVREWAAWFCDPDDHCEYVGSYRTERRATRIARRRAWRHSRKSKP